MAISGISSTPASFESAMLLAGQKDIASTAGKKLNTKDMAQIDASAKDFEALFVSEMMSHMFNSVQTDPMFGGGHGEDTFRSMLVSEYGKLVAKEDGIGIAEQISKAMIDLQEKANN